MKTSTLLFFLLAVTVGKSQNFTFNFNTTGQRVCLVTADVDTNAPSVTIKLLDAASNTNKPTFIYRRPLYGNGSDWVNVASNLVPGTTEWIDTNVQPGEVWEYQIKRANTWFYASQSWDATGYTVGSLLADKTNYQGQLILLVADNIPSGLPEKYARLKKELTGEGWHVNEIVVPKAASWDSGNDVVGIRNQIIAAYNSAPANDKPKMLFILGHVPMPRSGSTGVTAPDAHDQNKGARGCDAYYADVDGIYTDTATFNPGGLQTTLAVNNPGDFKWDQDFLPSEVELAFGRVDFQDLTDFSQTELQLTEIYLDKLSNYRNVADGFNMGNKSAFSIGYDNSNDGSYRSLPEISKPADVYQNTSSLPYPQWVQQNGPFKIYMQNQFVPQISEWNTYGMDATVFSSDQSYWGYNDMPQQNDYGRIRSLLATNTKCIVTLWTTTGVNIFHEACSGDPLGLAVREIVNHNTTNIKLQKPPQNWDTQDWWNRTHFAYNGDPTIRLYQVKPVSNLTISSDGLNAILDWSPSTDGNVIGYHIYKSDSEFGIYQKISTSLVLVSHFALPDYQQNEWYMVRPVSIAESGCGKFYNPGLGVFVKGDFALANPENSVVDFRVWPNPARTIFSISAANPIDEIQFFTIEGVKVIEKKNSAAETSVDVSGLASGIYLLRVASNGKIDWRKIAVE